MENKKRTLTIVGIFTFILAIIGGTLAYWTWTTNTTEQTNVVFTVTQDFSCAADGGGNITSNDVMLAPTTCTDTSRAIKRKVAVTPTLNRETMTLSMDLWLTINDLGEGLKKSNNFRYVLTTSDSSCEEGTIMASGNFKGRKVGNKVNLLTNELYTETPTEPEEYWLYIWLDEAEASSATMNQTFSLSLGGQCEEIETLVGDAYALLLESDVEYETLDQFGYTPYELIFLRSETPITASEYDGKQIINVYSGIETAEEGSSSPWGYYMQSLVVVEFKDTIRPISTAYWFSGFGFDVYTLREDFSKLDTSQVTNMSGMFYGALSGDGESISNFDVSKVRNMRQMFSSSSIKVDLSNWNVSNVTNMSEMFTGSNMNNNDLSSWDVSNVIDMSNMFNWVYLNYNIGISNWNVSNVTNMSGMFNDFEIILDDLSSWDTSSVTNMSQMFYNTTIGIEMDLSGWDVSKVTDYTDFNTDVSGTGTLTLPKFGVTQ